MESDNLISVKENLNFEGFLRKRKDTMKFTWARYWFKLQNTTLYFYTEPEETSLRGQYYMYSVQSVRSLSNADGDFPFEIVMKNGKRKLLSAESEDLRDVWIRLLWKSMQLPGPGRHNSSCTWYDIPELIQRVSCSSTEGQALVVTDENNLKDDVFEQPAGAAQTAGGDDNSGPDAAHDTPTFLHTAQLQYIGEDSGDSSDSDIYDVPRPQATALHCERTADAVAEEQQCTSLSRLGLDDAPTLSADHPGVSGLAQATSMDGTDISCPVRVEESPAEKSSP